MTDSDFTYWRNRHTGTCFFTRGSVSWPSSQWERISKVEFDQWAEDRRGFKFWTDEQKAEQERWEESQKDW